MKESAAPQIDVLKIDALKINVLGGDDNS